MLARSDACSSSASLLMTTCSLYNGFQNPAAAFTRQRDSASPVGVNACNQPSHHAWPSGRLRHNSRPLQACQVQICDYRPRRILTWKTIPRVIIRRYGYVSSVHCFNICSYRRSWNNPAEKTHTLRVSAISLRTLPRAIARMPPFATSPA